MKNKVLCFTVFATSALFGQGKCPFNYDAKPSNTPSASVQEMPTTSTAENPSKNRPLLGSTS
ncbi:MAG: hypothetical protein RLZZ68_1706, partial [Bacteroidota bacterium]